MYDFTDKYFVQNFKGNTMAVSDLLYKFYLIWFLGNKNLRVLLLISVRRTKIVRLTTKMLRFALFLSLFNRKSYVYRTGVLVIGFYDQIIF